MKKILLICLFSVFLSACGSKVLDISSFKNGEAVAWIVPEDNASDFEQEQDCEKIFSTKKNLILVVNNENGNYILRQYWGGSTQKQTMDAFPIAVDPVEGRVGANFKISSSTLEGNQLVQVVTRPDGANLKFTYTQSTPGKNGITAENMEFVNPTEDQQKEYETLKYIGAIKPLKYSLCSAKSFKSYLNSKKPKDSAKAENVGNALNYVFGKKWSTGDLNCNLNGGAYSVFTKDRGLVLTVQGQEQKPPADAAPMNFEYVDASEKGFTYKQTYYANAMVGRFLNDPKAVSAEIEKQVVLVDNNKITYRNKIKQLNFDKMLKGVKEYEIKEENGFGNLCP